MFSISSFLIETILGHCKMYTNSQEIENKKWVKDFYM